MLVFVLAGTYRTALIDPGELSFQHAGLTDCGSCHQAFHQGMVGWWHAAWSEDVATDDSKPCISCHAMGDRGLMQHSQSAEVTSALSELAAPATASGRSIGVQLANLVFDMPRQSNAALPCMSCHQEHQGAEADLTDMSNDRCTTCHLVQFDSLASGHPDFQNYPYERRTRLRFDHTSHIDKHFLEKSTAKLAPGDCRDCHKSDANGRLMKVKSFDTSCAACHGEQIAGAGRATAKGMPVLAVPGLDVATLQEKGAAIGEWPEFAEGPIPNFMKMLLSADAKFRDADAVLAGIDDPLDLSEATKEQLAAIETVAWSVKSLLYDLRAKGVVALHERLAGVLQRPLTAAEKTSLTALLPLDTVVNAQMNWFPSLGADIPRWRNGDKVMMPSEETLPAAEESGKDSESSGSGGKDSDDKIDTGKDDDDDDEITSDEDDEDDDEIATGKDGDDDDDASEKERATVSNEIETASGEDWHAVGGWYVDEFTIRYRPTGHSDGFILAWINLTGKLVRKLKESGGVFEGLINAKSPGLCGKCHSVDQVVDGSFKVNWHGYRLAEGLKKSVHFSHAAHFSLLDEKGCMTCHIRDVEADYASGFNDRDPTTYQANFKPLPRQVCAECHTSAKAGDKCLSCHNYHLGIYQPVEAHTSGMLKQVSNKP